MPPIAPAAALSFSTVIGYPKGNRPANYQAAEQGYNQIVVRGSSPFWLTVRGSSTREVAHQLAGDGRLEVELGMEGV